MARAIIDPELEEELAAVAESAGCELLDVEYRGERLRVVLDRPEGGVSLADCETVSKQLSALLDVVDFGDGRYTLEVSSPGLDRPLYRPEDYERFSGRLVRVTFLEDEGGVKRTVVGRLEEYRPDEGEISLLLAQGGTRLEIPLSAVETARLEVEL